jgi:ERF superfamily
MKRSNSIMELAKALSKFQKTVSNPKYDAKNPQYSSKYATLGNVINTVREPLTENGLSFMQEPYVTEDGLHVGVTTLLMHESGEFIESQPLILPAFKMGKGGVKVYDAQSAGIAISYGRRYSLSSILGISSEEDEDANGIRHEGNSKQSYNKPANSGQTQNKQQSAPPKNAPPTYAKKEDKHPEPPNEGQAAVISPEDLKAVNTLMSNYVTANLKAGETVDEARAKLKDWLRKPERCGPFENVQFMTPEQGAKAKAQLKALINKQGKSS